MTYLRGNARIALLLGATLAGSVLLGACVRSDAEPVPQRATTTTTWWTTTTTEAWSDGAFSEDAVFNALVEAVPALANLPRPAVRSQLLQTVCDLLDRTDGDFATTGESIVTASASNFGFDYGDAGSITAAAVALQCPEWLDAAQQWASS